MVSVQNSSYAAFTITAAKAWFYIKTNKVIKIMMVFCYKIKM